MLNVKGTMKPLIKALSRAEKKQIPFATAMAINSTLFDIRAKEMKMTHAMLDRPTNTTAKGFRVKKATKQKPQGEVFIAPHVWEYMRYQVEGGRKTKADNVLVSVRKDNLNKFGNIKGKKTNLIKRNQFVATIKGTTAVWQKMGGKRNPKLRMVVGIWDHADYSKRFPFYGIADQVAKKNFGKNFKREIARAMRTAR